MRRFVQLVSVFGLTAAMVLPACGGTTADSTSFSSGLPPSEKLGGLSQPDKAQLCDRIRSYLHDEGPTFCKSASFSKASTDVAFRFAQTDSNVQKACSDSQTACEQKVQSDTAGVDCPSFDNQQCAATLGEYEACIREEFSAMQKVAAGFPACSSLTVADVQSQ